MAGSTCSTAREYMDSITQQLQLVNDLSIDKATQAIYNAWRGDRRVFVYGNGGSAHSASHWALDLMKTAAIDGQPRLKALSLVDNIGTMTAVGNDISFDEIFRYPLHAYAEEGDVAVAISCSGNSANAVYATQWARAHGMTTITLTGFNGGKLRDLGDINVHVPSDNYGVVEEIHMACGHMVAQGLRHLILAGEKETVATW
ncbi:MAG: SIS domain-containing protein [Phycisphaeraceae bacterium]|nr:SIS domain-containing protein [Phycisphaeraceae bacterium]